MSICPSIKELRRRLTDDLENVLPRILTDVQFEGSELVGKARDGVTIKVALRGHKRGFVLDTSDPHSRDPRRRGGNLFNLVMRELADGTPVGGIEVATRLLSRCGIIARDPAVERRAAELRERDDTARRQRAAEEVERRRRRLIIEWNEMKPMTPETPAWQYLAARDCALASDAVRSGRRWHADAKSEFDVMGAIVIDPITARRVGTHVTYLTLHDGVWRKAEVAGAKITCGRIGGGVIPLLRGVSGLPICQASEETLLIGEGIENSLSMARFFPDLRCWAGLYVGNLHAICLPRQFSRVMLIRDRDGTNQSAHDARAKAIKRWQSEGRGITLLDPPLGFKDVNDWVRGKRLRPAADGPP
jgi:hypothetical protein